MEITSSELTFIILVRSSAHSSFNARSNPASPSEINSYQMIGDVNLFLKGSLDDENLEAEVEIMIAGMFQVQCICFLFYFY